MQTALFGKPLPAVPSTIINQMQFHYNPDYFSQIYECQLGKKKKSRGIHGSEVLTI